jgi:hypothetical protein
MSKHFVWLSLVDFFVFLGAWVLRNTLNPAVPSTLVQVVYWVTAFAGLMLAVYGFLALTRGRSELMSRSILCILFALVPGIVGLVGILSHLGTQPV